MAAAGAAPTGAAAARQRRPYRMSMRAQAAAATGERLLDAAWRHFSERPYEDVVLRDIAAEAGVTQQTLHAHFRSKEELFSAAFLRWGQHETVQRDTAPVGRVPEAIAVLFERYETQGAAVLRLLSQEERIPAVCRMTEAGRAYHRQWVARTFAPQLRGLRGGARERQLTAMVLATDLLAWKLLRRDMRLERAEAEAIVAEMVVRCAARPEV
jgi:AcrR family transcriptional regulator